MAEDQKRFWTVRKQWFEQPIPTLHEEVAQVFRERGWEVTELPGAALDDIKDLRRVLTAAASPEASAE
jgi:hypothetical protein